MERLQLAPTGFPAAVVSLEPGESSVGLNSTALTLPVCRVRMKGFGQISGSDFEFRSDAKSDTRCPSPDT